jgi:putative transposase
VVKIEKRGIITVINHRRSKMGNMRKQFGKEFKAKVALEALKELKTTAQLSSEYGVHPTQIAQWKKELKDKLPDIFSGKSDPQERQKDQLIDDLYNKIGKIQIEHDWLKKKLLI